MPRVGAWRVLAVDLFERSRCGGTWVSRMNCARAGRAQASELARRSHLLLP